MSLTTTTEFAAPVNVVLQEHFLRNVKPRCPYYVGSDPASIKEHAGSFTAKWLDYANLTPVTAALSELTGAESYPTRNAVQASQSNVTATVAKYGNHILLTEEADLVNPSQQEFKLSEVIAINCGQSLNRLQRDELEDNATVFYASGVATAALTNAKISASDVRRAFNTLENNNADKFFPHTEGSVNIGTAPIRESYIGICHVDVGEDIRDITGFQDVVTYSSQVSVMPGEIGIYGGVRWVTTTEASITTDTGNTGGTDVRETTNSKADLYYCPIFGKDAVGSLGLGTSHIKESYQAGDKLPGAMMFTVKKEHSLSDPYAEFCAFGWKSWHAAKILKSDWIRTLCVAATDLSN